MFFLLLASAEQGDRIFGRLEDLPQVPDILTRLWLVEFEGPRTPLALPHLVIFDCFSPQQLLERFGGQEQTQFLAKICLDRFRKIRLLALKEDIGVTLELKMMVSFLSLLSEAIRDWQEYCVLDEFIPTYLAALQSLRERAEADLCVHSSFPSPDVVDVVTKMMAQIPDVLLLGPAYLVEAMDFRLIPIVLSTSVFWQYECAEADKDALEELGETVADILSIVQSQAFHHQVAKHLSENTQRIPHFSDDFMSNTPFFDKWKSFSARLSLGMRILNDYTSRIGGYSLCENPECSKKEASNTAMKECGRCYTVQVCSEECMKAMSDMHRPECDAWVSTRERTITRPDAFMTTNELFYYCHVLKSLVLKHWDDLKTVVRRNSANLYRKNPRTHCVCITFTNRPIELHAEPLSLYDAINVYDRHKWDGSLPGEEDPILVCLEFIVGCSRGVMSQLVNPRANILQF